MGCLLCCKFLQRWGCNSRSKDWLQAYEPFVDTEDVALGERYGYKSCLSADTGYDYMAGGSGKILNRNVVEKMAAIRDPELRFYLNFFVVVKSFGLGSML
jgi:hypothetical protein